MKVLKSGLLSIVAVLTIFLAVAAAAEDNYTVRLGYYNCDHMTAAPVAKDAGIFKELGLKVDVLGNARVPEAMAAGQMDVGYIWAEGMMRAVGKGAPMFIGANNHLGGSHYLVVSNRIKEPKDLIGKKVALGIDPEKTSAAWLRYAEKLNLPPEGKNYETFQMTDKDEYLSLKIGRLDGMMTCDPWASMAEYEKTGRVLETHPKLPNGEWGVCCVFAMQRDFVAKHPEIARKMILAHSRAIQFIYLNPLQTAKIFSANYLVPEEVALMTIYKKTVEEGRTLTWEMDKRYLQNEIDYVMKVGTTKEVPPAAQMLDDKLFKEAGTDDFRTFIKTKVDPLFPSKLTYTDWKKKVMARGL
jgi:NitT/TauT family transport system substrate-binding protein